MESGELKSLLETIPVLSQNTCGVLNASEAEIRSAARRRVRKSRGEQDESTRLSTPERARIGILRIRHCRNCCRAAPGGQPRALSPHTQDPYIARFQRLVIVNKRERLCGEKGRDVIWPSN